MVLSDPFSPNGGHDHEVIHAAGLTIMSRAGRAPYPRTPQGVGCTGLILCLVIGCAHT